MQSSGTTGISTSGSGAVTLVTVVSMFNFMTIVNTSANAGFFSVDGGNTWGYIPASGSVTWHGKSNTSVQMKRATGTDISGVFAFAEWVDYR